MTLAALIVASLAAASPSPSAVSAAVDAAARAAVASKAATGTSFAVVENGKLAFAGAAGERDLAGKLPVTTQTLFRIGSVTKLMTAVSVMQLVEKGELALDDPVAKFVPSMPQADRVTVRDLLMHRSGYPDYADLAISSGAVARPTTPDAILASVAAKPLGFAPGTAFAYSNTNYVLLGRIVERISGQSLHDYYREHLFAPAGMRATYAGAVPASAPLALGYQRDQGDAVQSAGDVSWYYACGDVASTASDLARFDIALMDGRLLKPATFETMIAAAKPSSLGSHVEYGLGVMVSSFGAVQTAGHHGGLPGFEADDELAPSDGFAVVALGNDFLFPTSTIVGAAFASAYPDQVPTVRARAAADAAVAAAPVDPAITQRFEAFLEGLLGGKVDPSQLSAAMKQAMTPEAVGQIASTFAPYGAFSHLEFRSRDVVGGYTRYHYDAVFAAKTQPMMFVLDSGGLIAGWFDT